MSEQPKLDVLAAVLALTERHPWDVLVSLPQIRAACPHLTRYVVDTSLLALEYERRVFLKIANDPTCVPEGTPRDGIQSHRGLLFFAAVGDA